MSTMNAQEKSDISSIKAKLEKSNDPLEKSHLYEAITKKYKVTNLDSALIMCDQAIAYFFEIQDTAKMLVHQYEKSKCYLLKGEFKSAIAILKANEPLLENHNPKTTGYYYSVMASAYGNLAKSDSALHYHYKSLEACKKYGNGKCAYRYSSLAEYFNHTKQYDKAFAYAQQADKDGRFLQRAQKYINLLHMLDATTGMKDELKWIETFKKLDIVKHELGMDSLAVYHYGDIAVQNLEDNERIRFYESALFTSIDKKHSEGAGRIVMLLAEDYLKSGQHEKIRSLYKRFKYSGILYANANPNLTRIYATSLKSQGQFKEALKLTELYKTESDSLATIQDKKTVFELQEKYESEKKEKEIAKQNVLLVKGKNQRNLILGLLLLSILTLFGFAYRSRYLRKLNLARIKNLESEQKIMALDYIVQGQEAERKRIARDLHDGLGGLLATAKIQLKNIQSEIDKLQNLSLMTNAESLIDNAYKEVRRISHDMMPATLVELGFVDAIKDLANQINLSNQIWVDCEFFSDGQQLNENQSILLYRIIQELINNTLKHANAKHIKIQFSENDNRSLLSYEDDGKGFDMNGIDKDSSLGLKSIESRVNYLGGDLVYETKVGEGVFVEIDLQMDRI